MHLYHYFIIRNLNKREHKGHCLVDYQYLLDKADNVCWICDPSCMVFIKPISQFAARGLEIK